jgi:hypothetical protein
MTKPQKVWEAIKAIFWLMVAFFLIAVNHPKVQKIFGLLPTGSIEVWRNKHF